jgi:peptidoglycan/LPS O-acetylase OafA/YrhL
MRLGSTAHNVTEGRRPQLDSLRCVAVLVVIWSHTGGERAAAFGNFGVGPYGVWLFFVLSGFLITGILLRQRDNAQPLVASLRTFYGRRVLRIVPPYFALLAILLALGYPTVREGIVAHSLYVSNWYFIQRGPPYYLGHLWSLSVEEQFYLVWPLLVLTIPARRLPWIFVGAIAVAPVSRLAFALSNVNPLAVMAATTSDLDVLGIGALLAWHHHTFPNEHVTRDRALRYALLASLGLAAITVTLSITGRGRIVLSVEETFSAALASAWLINRCASGFEGMPRAILEWPVITYVGMISYAIYLWQSPVRVTIWFVAGWVGIARPGLPLFSLVTALSVLLATLSWNLLEQPMNRLKRRLPYTPVDDREEEGTGALPVRMRRRPAV